jgi:MFS family permease
MGCASLLGLRMSRTLLGPQRPAVGSIRNEMVVVARGLADGARYLAARRTPGQALLVMSLHRFLYGVVFIASILMSRNLLAQPGDRTAGLATFATVIGATGVGGGLAIVLTAVLARRMAPQSWIAVMLLVAGVSQLILVPEPGVVTVVTAAALLGLAAQGAKIAVDTIVQRDSEDAYRGRAFAFYDVLYNAAFVGAAALAAFLVPDAGWSPGLFVALSVGYIAASILFGMRSTRTAAIARQTQSG